MADDAYQPTGEAPAGDFATERTAWTGWIGFAGVMMVITGGLNAVYVLIEIVNDEWVRWTNRASLYLDISQLGTMHLIVGLVLLLSGIGVFSGNVLARTVGVIAAGVRMIAHFLFVPAYPLWALVVVAIDVLVVWALIAHGNEMRSA